MEFEFWHVYCVDILLVTYYLLSLFAIVESSSIFPLKILEAQLLIAKFTCDKRAKKSQSYWYPG
jgi:hypothetical protein